MEIAMSSQPTHRVSVLAVLTLAMPLVALTACADPAMVAELQQDEQTYVNVRDRLYDEQQAGNVSAAATDAHSYKLAILKLREDRGIENGPNDREHQEKEGHVKP
jgi:hypothetical protein